jgi:glycosyltransferase involved in cell wall biosynthesis
MDKNKLPQLSILVPVYNEEKTLLKILKATTSIDIGRYEVIVVDDASTDGTGMIIEKFKKGFKSKNVTLSTFKHLRNLGKGAGIQTGLKHAKGEYFVVQDADLEYNPRDIPPLLKEAQINNYDVVYGSRFLGDIKSMPRANYYANVGYNIILRILYRTSVTDMHTCYKMVRTSLFKELKMSSNGFDYATELISKLLRKGYEIHEVPISFVGRTKHEGKKIDILDGVECAYKLLSFRFGGSGYLYSEKGTTALRFLIVGGIGFLTNYAILVVLTQFNTVQHIIAETIAAAVALQVTFLLHNSWTYNLKTQVSDVRLPLTARYVSYILTNAFGSFMTVVMFGVLYSYVPRLPSLLLAAVLGIVWNYLVNTYVIWSTRGKYK